MFCPNGRTQHITGFVYEDQYAIDFFDEKTTISSSKWRDLVFLYVVHVYDVQKIQQSWRTSYSYTHAYFCTCTMLRRSYTYKSTMQNSLVYDRVDTSLVPAEASLSEVLYCCFLLASFCYNLHTYLYFTNFSISINYSYPKYNCFIIMLQIYTLDIWYINPI